MYFRSIASVVGLFSTLVVIAPAQAGCHYAGCYSHSHVTYNQYQPSPYLNFGSEVPYYAPVHHSSHRLMRKVKTTRTLYQPVTQIVPVQSWKYVTTYQPVAKKVVRHGWGGSHSTVVYPSTLYPSPTYPALTPAAINPTYPAPHAHAPLYPAQMIYGY